MPIPREVPFEKWTVDDATKVVKVPTEFPANVLFIDGDHWQGGAGWVGPIPKGTEDGAQEVIAQIGAAFTSRNVIGEVVERHSSGVVGIEPIWGLVPLRALEEGEEPTAEEQALIDEAEALLTTWWDRRGMVKHLQQFAAYMLYAGRAVLRLYVPPGLIAETEDGDRVQATDDADALDHVYVGTPSPAHAAIHVDPRTEERVGVFKAEVDGRTVVELVFRAARGQPSAGEVAAQEGDVVVRMLGLADGGNTRTVLPLGGRLTMFQGERTLLITQQVQQLQRALNLAISMLPRNVVTGGFLERVILNGMMPGHYEDNPNGGDPIFVPSPMRYGAGVTNWIVGVEDEDEASGTRKTLTPDVRWRDPIDVKPAIEAKEELYASMLEEVDQAHVLLNTDAGASGRSREESRTSYVSSLTLSRGEVEGAVRWLAETLLALMETFTGTPGRFTSVLRAVASCQLDEGPLSPEERKQNVDEAKQGYLSKTRAIARNGVADPDAELAAIAAQEDSTLAIRKLQAEVIEILTRAGAPLLQAALAAGMDPETANLLARGVVEDEEEEEVDDPNPAPDTGEGSGEEGGADDPPFPPED